MDSATGAYKQIIEYATYRTLHAHGFSRSSSQASFVLSDLLSRYLILLSETCAKYAQHAGRTAANAKDAMCALEELGVGMEELKEYCGTEASELGRYAIYSARRVEDLHELKAQLSNGLKQDRDDVIPLIYAPVSDEALSHLSEDEGDEESVAAMNTASDQPMDTDMNESLPEGVDAGLSTTVDRPGERKDDSHQRLPSTPPLPLSPISNPSSPARKRPRTSSWRPPAHIPDFLPPFPNLSESSNGSQQPLPSTPPIPSAQLPPVKVEKPPESLPQPLTSTSASDYMTVIPYAQSSLSNQPEWHLPSAVPPPPRLPTRPSRLATPQTQPALISAYHHILTNPPPSNLNSANPARHKVAMALLYQTQTNPRWDPPDTLYSSIAPCPPRVAPIGPSYPIPISGQTSSQSANSKESDKEKERKSLLPSAPPRPVSSTERLTPLVSQQASRIPDLARQVLPGLVYTRVTRLAHPPVLSKGQEKLTYGPGVNAIWNANEVPPAPESTPAAATKDGAQVNGKGKEAAVPRTLPDARMYATWDYDQKHFNESLVVGRRARMGSIQGTSGVTLSLGRARSESKAG